MVSALGLAVQHILYCIQYWQSSKLLLMIQMTNFDRSRKFVFWGIWRTSSLWEFVLTHLLVKVTNHMFHDIPNKIQVICRMNITIADGWHRNKSLQVTLPQSTAVFQPIRNDRSFTWIFIYDQYIYTMILNNIF